MATQLVNCLAGRMILTSFDSRLGWMAAEAAARKSSLMAVNWVP